ncbi:hypothetical protein SCUCBS95973_000490 [Sporothrix curviconia]|uniref:G domain-containing protein n=1 Tax=Sporothrix curviconia TaxID=1260050 RepID=A0ABP0AQX4_9PEZI
MPNDLFTDGIEPDANDVVIALMGMTGAGKSSFISLCSDKKPTIGHDLNSCTQGIDTYTFIYDGPPRKRVFLVDTPGFDDSSRSDSEILRELAAWLSATYTRDIRLSGIIYLHRINQPRMQGSAKRNITLFKKLCGDDALQNVILVTTMWDLVGESVGAMRERELVSTAAFWGYMASKGSKAYRHDNTHASAMKLIGHFIQAESKMTLEIQAEMVHQHKDLDGTAAAAILDARLEQERARFTAEVHSLKAELEEAVRKKDRDTIDMLQDVRDEYKAELAQIKAAHESLRASMQKLHEERYANLERAMKKQQETHQTELPAANQSLAQTNTPTNHTIMTREYTGKPRKHVSNESIPENFAGREGHTSIIWDTITGQRVSSLYSHSDKVSLINLSSDGRRFSSMVFNANDL